MAKKRRGGKGQFCHWCRRILEASTSSSALAATKDHVWPQSRGGIRKVMACFSCNNLKSDMTPDEWRAFREMHPEWWRTHKRAPGRRLRDS